VGADHIIFGWIFFSIVMLILIGIGLTFSDKGIDEMPRLSDRSTFLNARLRGTLGMPPVAAALAAVIVLAGPLYAAQWSPGYGDGREIALAALKPAPGWRKAESAPMYWRPEFVGADAESLTVYRKDKRYISVYIGYYARQGPGRELIAYVNKIAAPQPWTVASQRRAKLNLGPDSGDVIVARALARSIPRTIYYVYWIDGHFTVSRYEAKLFSALQKLRGGGRGAAVIALSVLGEQDGIGEAELQDFLIAAGSFAGIIDATLPDARQVD